jgi:hypothetical protein
MLMNLELSVIVPAYNESARLGQSVRALLQYLNQHWATRAELIVVDDGSSDDTSEVAAAAFAEARATLGRLIRLPQNRGKGFAVRTGLLSARGKIAVFTDADLATPVTETPKLVAPIQQGEFAVVFGSRALDRRLIELRQPWRREQGGRVFNQLVRWLTGLPFHDTQCGFKAFHMALCRPLFETATIDRFGFDVELLCIAQLAGLRLCEMPVRWLHQAGSKVEFWRDSWRMFSEIRTIRRQARQGTYQHAIQQIQAAQRNWQLAARQPSVVPVDHSTPSPTPKLLAKARHV